MKATSKLFAVLCAAVILAACAAPGFKATHDYDDSVNFSSYQSFAWISQNPMKVGATQVPPSPLLEPRIMSSLEKALVAKGYRFNNQPNDADFVVSFTVGSREEIRVDSYPTMGGGYGGRWGWGGAYYGHGTQTSVRQYTQGMLAIDIFSVQQRRPVWHGYATKKITADDRENQLTTIDAAVESIIAGFPPP
ncbi:MAG: DUF4136 domain-containing protein [Aeoliella sp.]